MKMLVKTVSICFALMLAPTALYADECKDAPKGYVYKYSEDSHSISVNGRPFVSCKHELVGDRFGDADYYEQWRCTTFVVTKKGVGLIQKIKDSADSFQKPDYFEKWQVKDKNGNIWVLYDGETEWLKASIRNDIENVRTPVYSVTRIGVSGGCLLTETTDIDNSKYSISSRSSPIRVVIRESSKGRLVREVAPAF